MFRFHLIGWRWGRGISQASAGQEWDGSLPGQPSSPIWIEELGWGFRWHVPLTHPFSPLPRILDPPTFIFFSSIAILSALPSKIFITSFFEHFRTIPSQIMALPSDKKAIANEILPEVQFNVTSTGVTISSARFNTPRIVQFDLPGKCRGCKGTDLQLDHIITKDGIIMFSNRMKVGNWLRMIWVIWLNL